MVTGPETSITSHSSPLLDGFLAAGTHLARNYEPRSVASGETTEVLIFLMDQPSPSPAVRSTIEGGVSWPREVALRDHAAEGTERLCAVVGRR